jgi:hypothetical protein
LISSHYNLIIRHDRVKVQQGNRPGSASKPSVRLWQQKFSAYGAETDVRVLAGRKFNRTVWAASFIIYHGFILNACMVSSLFINVPLTGDSALFHLLMSLDHISYHGVQIKPASVTALYHAVHFK